MSYISKLLLLALTISLSSCCSWYGDSSYDLRINTTASMKNVSVEVNIIGITESDRLYWQGIKVDDYFGTEVQENSDKVTFQFNQVKQANQVLYADNAVWDKWLAKGVKEVYVIAALPGVTTGLPARQDPRVLVIPLDYCKWKADSINIEIGKNRVYTSTPMLQD